MHPIAYQHVVLIGTGRVACGCLQHVLEHTRNVVAIEPEQAGFSLVKPLCRKNGVTYVLAANRRSLRELLLSINEPTLVISAHNVYLFPSKVLQNRNLNVVNFHNSLLPRHPGRNAPTWAIFEMDRRAGVTWHQVNNGIDQGDILAQESIPIEPDTTALKLTKECADLGLKTFRKVLPGLLCRQRPGRPQLQDGKHKVHLSTEVPNDGFLDLAWSVPKISAFLRCLDYGKLQILPPPRICLLGRRYVVAGYSLRPGPETGGNRDPELRWGRQNLAIGDGTASVQIVLSRDEAKGSSTTAPNLGDRHA